MCVSNDSISWLWQLEVPAMRDVVVYVAVVVVADVAAVDEGVGVNKGV